MKPVLRWWGLGEEHGREVRKKMSFILGILSLKCFLDISLEVSNRQLSNILKGFPHHQTILQFSVDPSLASYNLTRFWHYLPGDSVRSHRWRAQSCKIAHFRHQWQVQFALLCLWPARGYQRFDHLLEWLYKAQENIYLCLSVYFKGYVKDTEEQSYEEIHQGRCRMLLNTGTTIPEGLGCTILLAQGCIHQPRSSSNFIQEFL